MGDHASEFPPQAAATADFGRRAAVALDRLESAIEQAADAAGADLEISRTDNVIEVECEDGSKLILNSHAAAGEIWLAARSGGYHFQPQADHWRDGRGGRELVEALSAELSAQAGAPIDLGAVLDGSL